MIVAENEVWRELACEYCETKGCEACRWDGWIWVVDVDDSYRIGWGGYGGLWESIEDALHADHTGKLYKHAVGGASLDLSRAYTGTPAPLVRYGAKTVNLSPKRRTALTTRERRTIQLAISERLDEYSDRIVFVRKQGSSLDTHKSHVIALGYLLCRHTRSGLERGDTLTETAPDNAICTVCVKRAQNPRVRRAFVQHCISNGMTERPINWVGAW